MNRSIVPLALVAAAIPAAPAAAGGVEEGYIVTVPYADLNLATADGRARLASRIDAAADGVCGYSGVISLVERQRLSRCRAEFTASANRQVQQVLARLERRGAYASKP